MSAGKQIFASLMLIIPEKQCVVNMDYGNIYEMRVFWVPRDPCHVSPIKSEQRRLRAVRILYLFSKLSHGVYSRSRGCALVAGTAKLP